jgi:hypothetical protein
MTTPIIQQAGTVEVSGRPGLISTPPYWRIYRDAEGMFNAQIVPDKHYQVAAGTPFHALESALVYASRTRLAIKLDPSVWEDEGGA